jgi:uncharacterized protein (TIGR00297 family)
MASLLFAFLFPYVTWEQAAGCAVLLLLFNTLILPWIAPDVAVGQPPWAPLTQPAPADENAGCGQPSPPRRRGLGYNTDFLQEGEGPIRGASVALPQTGVILYPISVLALVLLFRNHLHIAAAAWAIMAFADGMATVIGLKCRGDIPPQVPNSVAHIGTQSGSAAPTCGKPPAFRPALHPSSSSSAQAGRPSLPACAEEVAHGAHPSERRSLSASQAAKPQVLADKVDRYSEKRDFTRLRDWRHALAATLPWNRQKTWPGFVSFVMAGTVGAYILTRWIAPQIPSDKTLIVCAAAALLGAVVESLPIPLEDNITVPLVVGAFMFCAFLMERSALNSNLPYLGRRILLAIAVNLAFALLARALKAASRSGAICGFLLGTAIYLGYGYKSFLLLFAFVFLGSVATRVGFAKKAARGVAERRGGARSWREALANLLAPACLAILVITTHHEPACLIALVAALAEAAGDTVSSEIGQWASDRAYLITTFKLVPAGEDGGVTLAGTAAGIAASTIIMGLGLGLRLCGPYRFAGPAIALAAAAVGNFLDSFLGATLQRRGLVTNGMVNFVGTGVASALALGLALHLGL